MQHARDPDAVRDDQNAAPLQCRAVLEPAPAGKGLEDKDHGRAHPSGQAGQRDNGPDIVHHVYPFIPRSRRSSVPSLSFQTMSTASRTILFDIFELPAWRSMKMIGTSTMLNPISRQR